MGVTQTPPRGRRHFSKRLRIRLDGARPPLSSEIDEALVQVIRSGVVPVLDARLHRRRDARARLSVVGYSVGLALNSYQPHHKMLLVEIVRLLNALKPRTLEVLKMPEWTQVGSYDRFQRLHSQICAALDVGWTHLNHDTGELIPIDWLWYWTRVSRSPVPDDLVRGCALAVDAKAVSTWGRLHGGHAEAIDYDGEPINVDEDR